MKRREFIAGLAGAAALPLAARSQQGERVRRIGVLMPSANDSRQGQAQVAGFLKALKEAGWVVGRNVHIEYRWTAGKIDNARKYAMELTALSPDIIFASGGPNVAALQQATRSIPVVFVSVADPVAAGFVASLARPGGNMTGFMTVEYGISGKWLELLKQVAPGVTRVAVLRDLNNPSGLGQFGALQGAAPSFGVELFPVGIGNVGEIERGLETLGRMPNGGVVVPAGAPGAVYREPIIRMAARLRLPAVYSDARFVVVGGLLSYGPDRADAYRRAASYVDRILKGEKPSDLPVQAPPKSELVINLKTAKALGLTVPPTLIARADEVIE
jgi:putative ABC transport system substrate-binding protein